MYIYIFLDFISKSVDGLGERAEFEVNIYYIYMYMFQNPRTSDASEQSLESINKSYLHCYIQIQLKILMRFRRASRV